ncbi:MAG: hypothetical protein HYR92_05475, partial [Burkholderiales bacterium]|nr:hypothetical protein [Burkholderiales bacterium]
MNIKLPTYFTSISSLATITAITLITTLSNPAFATTPTTPDAQAILAASDAVRNPDFSYGLTATL